MVVVNRKNTPVNKPSEVETSNTRDVPNARTPFVPMKSMKKKLLTMSIRFDYYGMFTYEKRIYGSLFIFLVLLFVCYVFLLIRRPIVSLIDHFGSR
ncbi:hypothetical protein J8273_4826 [Carpediemonas membranifera]|uniref:Uncharacterized protein n=1 Tax=Carpediemonas membranifera TaxID=201153 RepID=A0A8J6B688_9EUKA|nr:hypothetical protein J8273_4826 [Carpediemonas membranifera]|eukprot:KAG9393707.1 hypothetical protein J8273_4826 [Carpediemonas membranifera]